MRIPDFLRKAIFGVILAMIGVGLWQLESERASVHHSPLETSQGDVTLYHMGDQATGPVVFVAHGFAGSQQMMQYIARDLARSGFSAVTFDFYGHGRNHRRMSADVSRIEGTTAQLVQQTERVVAEVRSMLQNDGPIGLVGHSMATDIIIRAAETIPESEAIVAISMYSDAVTGTFPRQLLVLSGAWETRLRNVGMAAVARVDPAALEGETVRSGAVIRRATSIPYTEHLTVLFSAKTMAETRNWLSMSLDRPKESAARQVGPWVGIVLAGLVVVFSPLMQMVLTQNPPDSALPTKPFFIVLIGPVLPAMLAAYLCQGAILNLAEFGGLLAFFVVWGVVALGLLYVFGRRILRLNLIGLTSLSVWGLGGFALALDRYGAAFIPVGPRLGLMAVLVPATVLFMTADRLLVFGAPLWQRIAARVTPIFALLASMTVMSQNMALLFTTLPVLVLFYLVFGTLGRVASLRWGPETTGLGLGIALAWAIAASTPLFVG